MSPRVVRLVLIGLAVIIVLSAGVWGLRRALDAQEPVYAGKTVDEWHELQGSGAPGVSNRVNAEITANVIPRLIDTLLHDTEDSRVKPLLADALNHLPGPTIVVQAAGSRRSHAAEGLGILGLSTPETISALLEVLRGKDLAVHANAAEALGRLHADPAQAVPVLLACLNDPQDPGRADAAATLAGHGPAAKAAVPVLIRLLDDRSSKELMASVRSALKQLDPVAAAQAGLR